MKKTKPKNKQAKRSAERADYVRIVCLNGKMLKELSTASVARYWRTHNAIKRQAKLHNSLKSKKARLQLENDIDIRLSRLNDWIGNEFEKKRAKKKTEGKKSRKKAGNASRRSVKRQKANS